MDRIYLMNSTTLDTVLRKSSISSIINNVKFKVFPLSCNNFLRCSVTDCAGTLLILLMTKLSSRKPEPTHTPPQAAGGVHTLQWRLLLEIYQYYKRKALTLLASFSFAY